LQHLHIIKSSFFRSYFWIQRWKYYNWHLFSETLCTYTNCSAFQCHWNVCKHW